ncbi:hypothetical protein HK101_002491 [Irineochytrium annulatum]|nr:hypothetical protein HK101_002491 [Irineochytrium annulatum]
MSVVRWTPPAPLPKADFTASSTDGDAAVIVMKTAEADVDKDQPAALTVSDDGEVGTSKAHAVASLDGAALVDSGATSEGEVTPQAGEGKDMTPLQILKSPAFWLYAMAFIWLQGLTYFNNIGTIVSSLAGPSANPTAVSSTTSLHVTLLSISNCLARLLFGAGSDVLVSRLHLDRSLLFLTGHLITAVPLAILGFSTDAISDAALCFASITTGFGWGAVSAVFTPLTRDFFGLAHFGSACAFVMAAIPAGLFTSNVIFGSYFDSATASGCRGAGCFGWAFKVFFAIQMVPIVFSLVLFVGREWAKRRGSAGAATQAPA